VWEADRPIERGKGETNRQSWNVGEGKWLTAIGTSEWTLIIIAVANGLIPWHTPMARLECFVILAAFFILRAIRHLAWASGEGVAGDRERAGLDAIALLFRQTRWGWRAPAEVNHKLLAEISATVRRSGRETERGAADRIPSFEVVDNVATSHTPRDMATTVYTAKAN
jgi:hypothetical protein